MGQTLTNNIYLPDEGERNCYAGLAANWRALDAHLGNTDIHVTYADKQAWNDHVADTVKHVTAEDKAKWDTVTSKADDSDVVHKSGDETVGGIKTFNNIVPINGAYIGNEPSVTYKTVLLLRSRYDTAGKSGWLVSKFRSNSAQGALSGSDIVFLSFDVLENEVRTNGILKFYLSNWSGDAPGRFSLIPSSSIESYLGNAGNKWKSFNGLEPSALSLPSGNTNDVIDISSYLVNLDGTDNTYVAPANGWIAITMSNSSSVQAYIRGFWGHQVIRPSAGRVRFLMPILKNQKATIFVFGGTVDNARFIPCQGNV